MDVNKQEFLTSRADQSQAKYFLHIAYKESPPSDRLLI